MSSRNGSSSSLNPSSGHLPLPNTASSAGSRVHDDASSFSSVPHIAPSSATRGRAGSLSSQNLLQATEEETIVVEATVQDDMDDIRRRREEVNARYDARLDYLRAKLKSAMLHEKLLKK
jgi:hypothetical protein